MNKEPFFIPFCFFISGLIVCAQTTPLPTVPQAPFISNAPTYAEWTITSESIVKAPLKAVSSTGVSSFNFRILQKIQVIKMDKDRHETDFWSDGQISEKWSYKNMVLFTQPGSNYIDVMDRKRMGAMGQAFPSYDSTDFPELEWVGLDSYQGIKTFQNHICYVYQFKRPPTASQKTPLAPGEDGPLFEAWIDKETSLPVQVNDRFAHQTFAFQTLPAGTMQLSERFAHALQHYESIVAKHH
jgi:hypothetical protein